MQINGKAAVIRIIKPDKNDISVILSLIKAKAEFDGCADMLRLKEGDIEDAFFSAIPKAFALLAVIADEIVGIATYYSIYSTFIAKPGIWLDDLFVYPKFRKMGVGQALLLELCFIARETGCGRIDWIVARDNEIGKDFYRSYSARIFEEVRHARLDEDAINKLADKARSAAS